MSKLYKTATYHLLTTVKRFSKALLMLRGGLYITRRSLTLLLCTGIPRIPYRPSAGPGEVMCFKHYHAEEVGVVHLLSWISVALTQCHMWHETAALRSVFLCAGADGEEDGGLAEVLGLLLALLLWNWYWGCTGRVYFTFTHLIYMFDLKWGFYIKHRSGSFRLPHPAPALEWRDSHGCSQEATAGSFWVLHQAGSERRWLRSATS